MGEGGEGGGGGGDDHVDYQIFYSRQNRVDLFDLFCQLCRIRHRRRQFARGRVGGRDYRRDSRRIRFLCSVFPHNVSFNYIIYLFQSPICSTT